MDKKINKIRFIKDKYNVVHTGRDTQIHKYRMADKLNVSQQYKAFVKPQNVELDSVNIIKYYM